MIEHEVKLAFESVEAARRSIEATGARLVVSRRLLDDTLFDTPDRQLRTRGAALRVRRDDGRAFITAKGPVLPGPVKAREEIETSVGDASIATALVKLLGFQPIFRSQKYRAEYALDGACITIDETPIGVFVEIEAVPDRIAHITALLGLSPADYRLESYPRLYALWCEAHGRAVGDMVFDS